MKQVAGGGAVAIRGFLVQTIVALLDITNANPPFKEIVLEPMKGDDQFDFLWKDANDISHAVQVKSTGNSFKKSDVENWAQRLLAARTQEQCKLVLVGNIPPSIAELRSVDSAVIETRNLDLDAFVEQAAHRLARFLEREKMDAGTAEDRELAVHALESKLLRYSTNATLFTRDAFAGVLKEWIASAPKHCFKVDISRIDKYAPEELIGREEETKLLNDAWGKAVQGEPERAHILSFVALGGEGKTSLAAKWVMAMAHQDWPGCKAAFAWSFYSQGSRDQAAVSSDLFLREALLFFGDENMAASPASGFDKGRRLALLAGESGVLLILDGLEPMQYPPASPLAGELKDDGLVALLKGLAAESRGLCIVTTRYSIANLRGYLQTTAPEKELKRLSTEAGVALLRKLGVTIGAQKDFEQLVEDVDGHALTLQIMGGFLKKAFKGDIRCRDRVKFGKADAKIQGGHAFRAMAAYGKWMEDESEEARRELAILKIMGLFDRPATEDCFQALLQAPVIPGLTEPLVGLAGEDLNVSLDALESAHLLAVNRDAAGALISLDAHPLLREYFARELRDGNPDGWRGGHQRLYEHLCATTQEGDQPTLEDLLPLYQAVVHGCQAGLQQEACDKVYDERILRGTGRGGFYSTHKLGAFGSDLGAVACFFERPWSRVAPVLSQGVQAWLLSQAAVRLRGLGRLTEALEPMRAGLEMAVKQEDWKNAAIRVSNLSELELTLGDVAEAVRDGERAVEFADRSGDTFLGMVMRTAQGDALHQAGQRTEAKALFREAEEMQAERQSEYPLLYSLQGFRYCDLLLAGAESQALKREGEKDGEELLTVYYTVSERATHSIKIAERNNWLLDIALDHLTLGRAALYRSILEQADFQPPSSDLSHIDQAVEGLRRSGTQHHLPRGLLTRAWLRSLTGLHTGPESAQSDLDEAWEIAERGPMRLHMADIHLYRARLFHDESDYPWESTQADVIAARRLIEKCGYWRRREELEYLESIIK